MPYAVLPVPAAAEPRRLGRMAPMDTEATESAPTESGPTSGPTSGPPSGLPATPASGGDGASILAPVAVLGAGAMGAGIAQVAATAGHPVLLVDVVQGAAAAARD